MVELPKRLAKWTGRSFVRSSHKMNYPAKAWYYNEYFHELVIDLEDIDIHKVKQITNTYRTACNNYDNTPNHS